MLNSDKTGTLTTARMSVIVPAIWTVPGFKPEEVLTWAALASNAANLDDPIDGAVLRAFREAGVEPV